MNPTVSETGSTKTKAAGLFKKSGKGKKKVVLLGVTAILLVAAGLGVYHLFFQKEEKTPITGRTTYGTLNEAIEGSGTTTPADSVTYEVNGTVLEWNVKAGDEVKAGDLLYVLDASAVEEEILEYQVDLEELYEDLNDVMENINNQNVTAPFSGRVQNIQGEVGRNTQNGTQLALLVDDSVMETTLYFGYQYQDSLYEGMEVTVSVPEQMLNLTGKVTDIRYVDYITTEGMHCFSAVIQVKNPGALTEGTTVTCWVDDGSGSPIYAVGDGELDYVNQETITAGASGELTAVNVVDYQRVSAGQTMFVIDASGYENQLETLRKQIENMEDKIADLQEAVDTEYSRYSDIDGQVVSANYSTNRMTGAHMGSVTIYNQQTMEIAVNIDELDADFLHEGMEVTVYRTTSASAPVYYPATLTYLSLEATAGSSGVSTFAATITIDSQGALASGVTVYYSIDTSGGEVTGDTVLAPISALCSYDDGYYLLVQRDKKPDNAIDPAAVGGSLTDYPTGYYAVPVEVGDYNGTYIQILSGVEQDETIFLRYMNARPAGGDKTSQGAEDEMGGMMMPDFSQMGGMPDFSQMGGMPSFGGSGSSGGSMPSFGGSGSSNRPSMGGSSGGGMPSFGGRG